LDAGDLFEPDADPHALVCATCRGRIRAARLLLAALAHPEPVSLPPNFADRVLADVRPASRLRNWRVLVPSATGTAAAALVAGSASKAFARLVRDVSAVQPGKPKS